MAEEDFGIVSFQVIISTPGVSIICRLVGCAGSGGRKINALFTDRGRAAGVWGGSSGGGVVGRCMA